MQWFANGIDLGYGALYWNGLSMTSLCPLHAFMLVAAKYAYTCQHKNFVKYMMEIENMVVMICRIHMYYAWNILDIHTIRRWVFLFHFQEYHYIYLFLKGME